LRRGGRPDSFDDDQTERAMPCHTLTPSACSRVHASS
jgi:hypothetical protein